MLLSFDIGIKNLAYCIVEIKDNKEIIRDMNILNLIEDDNKNYTCNFKHKNGNICKGKVLYKDINNKYYCAKHYNLHNDNKSLIAFQYALLDKQILDCGSPSSMSAPA